MIEFTLLPLLAGVLFLTALWRALDSVALSRHWPWWTSLVGITAIITTLVLAALVRTVLQEIRSRRERRELSAMEQRYPGCRVLRLNGGQWFLTDRSTGREYRPDDDAHHATRLGRTRDGSSAWMQKVSHESRARAESNTRP